MTTMESCSTPVFDLNTVTPYLVDRGGGKNKSAVQNILSMLRANRLIYFKKSCGDCGAPAQASGVSGTAIAQTGVAATKAGLGIASTTGVIASSTALTSSIFLAPIGIGLGIFGAISAHHKQAVATEQSTICNVMNAYNNFANQMEAALKAGKIPLQDAIVALQQAHDQLINVLNAIYKACNAACVYMSALDSLFMFNKKYVYPSLIPSAQVFTTLPAQASAPAQATPSQSSGTGQQVPASTLASNAPILGLGLVGAHYAGVF